MQSDFCVDTISFDGIKIEGPLYRSISQIFTYILDLFGR